MSLLSTDITKLKRLSLREVKLPAPEIKEIEKPPTDEEIAYSKLLARNPLLSKLIERLNLASCKTGNTINRVNVVI
jgi:hypothetical protein